MFAILIFMSVASIFTIAEGGESCVIKKIGAACKFPFVYNGIEYNGCTMEGNDRPWCAIKIGKKVRRANCPPTCKMHIPGDWCTGKYSGSTAPEGTRCVEYKNKFCQNKEGPWGKTFCWTKEGATWKWGAECVKCPDYKKPRECVTGLGENYSGTWNTTKSGLPCLNWYKWNEAAAKSLGVGNSNYCRNPTGHKMGPWCYVDDKRELEACDVPVCCNTCSCPEFRKDVQWMKGEKGMRGSKAPKTAESCQSWCQEFSSCVGWSFWASHRQGAGRSWCYLYDNYVNSSLKKWGVPFQKTGVVSPGAVSGLKYDCSSGSDGAPMK